MTLSKAKTVKHPAVPAVLLILIGIDVNFPRIFDSYQKPKTTATQNAANVSARPGKKDAPTVASPEKTKLPFDGRAIAYPACVYPFACGNPFQSVNSNDLAAVLGLGLSASKILQNAIHQWAQSINLTSVKASEDGRLKLADWSSQKTTVLESLRGHLSGVNIDGATTETVLQLIRAKVPMFQDSTSNVYFSLLELPDGNLRLVEEIDSKAGSQKFGIGIPKGDAFQFLTLDIQILLRIAKFKN